MTAILSQRTFSPVNVSAACQEQTFSCLFFGMKLRALWTFRLFCPVLINPSSFYAFLLWRRLEGSTGIFRESMELAVH